MYINSLLLIIEMADLSSPFQREKGTVVLQINGFHTKYLTVASKNQFSVFLFSLLVST